MTLGDIKIYNKDFELIAIIPQFISSYWELKFCGYGSGEIQFEKDDELVSMLYDNEYLFLVQNDIQSIITGYTIGKVCTVFTRTLEWLLTKFIVKEVTPAQNLSKTIENILSALPQSFNLKFCGIDDSCDMSDYTFYEMTDIYSAITECITDEKTGFSFNANFHNKSFTFSLKQAQENEDIVLCDEYKTSYDSEHIHDIQNRVAGACYYHQVTYMGKWNPTVNEPQIRITPENYGKYYVVSVDGNRFGLSLKKDDIILCTDPDGSFTKVAEAKPFLVEILPGDDGVFSWSEVLDAKSQKEAARILKSKRNMDLVTLKTNLDYGVDYKIGDIIKVKFFGRDKSLSAKKIVSEMRLWLERDSNGASPVMTNLTKEDENGI